MKTANNVVLSGTSLQEKTFDILDQTGTNWNAIKLPLQSESGLKTRSHGMFRSDNDKWIGTVGDAYTPMQNDKLVETLVEASLDMGINYRGGLLNGGEKVFYQIEIDPVQIDNDSVKRWLTAINSHNGSTGIGFGSTNTVVVCQNTFYRAYKDMSKIRHSVNHAARVEQVKKQLMSVLKSDSELMDSYKRMTEVKIDRPLFERIITKLFDLGGEEKTEKDVSKRKAENIRKFENVFLDETASHGENLWGLFNSVTYFENHVRGKEEKRLESIYLGTASRNMNYTYDQIMAYITEHTPKIHVIS